MEKSKIDTLIDKLEDRACDCDMMLGWSCTIHNLVRELKEEINVGKK